MKDFTSFFVFLLTVHTVLGGYGDESNGYPNYQERAAHHVTNMVRVDPTTYKNSAYGTYSPSLSGVLNAYPAQNPMYQFEKLTSGARYHSTDMANNGCFSHNSCDGTNTFTRIGRYYTCDSTMAENIAAGNADPMKTINQWLCDQNGGSCCPDGNSCDGHRRNIMSANYRQIGNGFAYNAGATYRNYWTQDFGGKVCPTYSGPIYSGTHVFMSTKTRFMAIWFSSAAPSSAAVVINGARQTLTRDLGTAQRGNYVYETDKGSACREYYFEFKDASGNTYYYPESGALMTNGESCTQSWKSSKTGAAASATTGPATTGPVTTGPVTTGPATTGPVTTGPATTGPATTGPATTGPATTGPQTATTGTSSTTLGYGDDVNGYPNWQERATHQISNMVRIDPTAYKTNSVYGVYSKSMANILGAYPAQNPMYYLDGLVNIARYHSTDMANNGCFSHNSCDGTDTFARIQSKYTCGGYMGENIAAGFADPLTTINQWLCDESGGACCADNAGCDGHRSNIMSANFKVIGNGYALNSAATYRHYWTQDFGGNVCPSYNGPIYSGSHIFVGSNTRFMAVWSSSAAPSSAVVIIDGARQTLNRDLGTAQRGNYVYESAKGSACREYYFEFKDASGNTYYYPQGGLLLTTGEGSCTQVWKARSGSGSGSTTGVAGSTTGVASSTTGSSSGQTNVAGGATLNIPTSGGSATITIPAGAKTETGSTITTAKYSPADSSMVGFVDPLASPPSEYKGLTFFLDYFDESGNPVHEISSSNPTTITVKGPTLAYRDMLFYYDTAIQRWIPAIFSCARGRYWQNSAGLNTWVCHATQYAVFAMGPFGDEVDEYNAGEPPAATVEAVQSENESGTNMAIIGGAIGGGVALLLIVGVVAFLVYKKKGSSSYGGKTNPMYEDSVPSNAPSVNVLPMSAIQTQLMDNSFNSPPSGPGYGRPPAPPRPY